MAIINGRGIVGIRSGVSAGPSTPSIVTNGLKLYLDAGNVTSYPGTGTVWTDLSGNGNNATLNGGVTYNSSNSGNLVFNGSTGYVDGPNLLYGESKATLSGWVKKTNTSNPISFGIMDSLGGNRIEIVWYINGYLYGECGPNDNFWVNSIPPIIDTNWHFISIVYDGTQSTNYGKIKIYFDGALLTPLSQFGTIVSTITTTGRMIIGNRNTGYSNGRISNIQVYNRALSDTEILQNYNTLKSRFYPQVSDSDAQSFIYAANIQDSTQATAVNTLVTSMKTVCVWTKMKAIYPFVGGTASSHKFNLKDPRDLNAAYRLTFTAGWVHSSTGAKANGTSDYADTFYYPSVSSNINSSHISYYARTGSNNNTVWVGSGYAGFLQSFGGTMYGSLSSGLPYYMSVASSNYQFAMVNRTSSNYMELRKLGVMVRQSSAIATGYDATPYRLNTFGNTNYSPSECAFSSIGDGLTDTEASNLYTAVQTYQTTLGRQV